MSTLEDFAKAKGYEIRIDRRAKGDLAPVREFVLTSGQVAEVAQLQARVAELEAALREVVRNHEDPSSNDRPAVVIARSVLNP